MAPRFQRYRAGSPSCKKITFFQEKLRRLKYGYPSFKKVWSFQQYKSKYMSRGECIDLTEHVRLFIWSLVQKLQQYHDGNKCPRKITSKTVVVSSRVVHLLGKKLEFSVERAMQNYEDLHKFLLKKLFEGPANLPHRIHHFMDLLTGDPLSHKHFIAWHIAILSTAYQIAFIVNAANVPATVSHDIRKQIYDAIDLVPVDENWENAFLGIDNVLTDQFNRPGLGYESVCPAARSNSLLLFHRDCVMHPEVGMRTRYDVKDFRAWCKKENIDSNPIIKKLKNVCSPNAAEPTNRLEDLLPLLFSRFPTFLTDVQNSLHEHGLLELVSVSPSKFCRC